MSNSDNIYSRRPRRSPEENIRRVFDVAMEQSKPYTGNVLFLPQLDRIMAFADVPRASIFRAFGDQDYPTVMGELSGLVPLHNGVVLGEDNHRNSVDDSVKAISHDTDTRALLQSVEATAVNLPKSELAELIGRLASHLASQD